MFYFITVPDKWFPGEGDERDDTSHEQAALLKSCGIVGQVKETMKKG